MSIIPTIVLYSFFSGITVFIGGLLSWIFQQRVAEPVLKDEVLHTTVAVGGGILVAAVAFVLVPEGMNALSTTSMAMAFLLGAGGFFLLDRFLQTHGGSYAQILAMLMDYIPEAIALGAVFATDHRMGLLIAIFIGLQNLPEAFNSYLDLRRSGYSTRTALGLLFVLSFFGIFAAVPGYLFLRDLEVVKGSLMLFSGGGIIYLIFQDIAPLSKTDRHWFPALGASFGFLVGMIGQKILG